MIQKISRSFLIFGLLGTIHFSSPLLADENLLADFRPFALPNAGISGIGPIDVVGTFIKLQDSKLFDTPVKITSRPEQNSLIVDIIFSEYKDDSISGENYRLIIQKTGKLFLLKRAGVQFVCARGSNAGHPQTNFCP